MYGCSGESLKLTCRVNNNQDQAFIRLRWRIQFNDSGRLHTVEETYDKFYREGHLLIAEIMHINAHFGFNLTFVNSSMLESTLMMDAHPFLDEALIHCGENLHTDYLLTVVSIVNGKVCAVIVVVTYDVMRIHRLPAPSPPMYYISMCKARARINIMLLLLHVHRLHM